MINTPPLIGSSVGGSPGLKFTETADKLKQPDKLTIERQRLISTKPGNCLNPYTKLWLMPYSITHQTPPDRRGYPL